MAKASEAETRASAFADALVRAANATSSPAESLIALPREVQAALEELRRSAPTDGVQLATVVSQHLELHLAAAVKAALARKDGSGRPLANVMRDVS